jgi:outer membrane lipoprotein-sorting protein
MKTYPLLRAALLAALGASGAARALTGPEIAAQAYAVATAATDSYAGFNAAVVQIGTDADGKELSRVTGRAYFTKPGTQRFEMTELVVDGKKQEIPKDEGKKKDDKDFEIKSPFDKEYFNKYSFTYMATETVTGVECYKVDFAAANKGEGYCYGSAWVAADDFRMVKSSGRPYVQPEHCSASSMTTFFRVADGRAMPYKQVVYVKATFLKFINKEMWFTSYITDYRFD